MTTTRRLRSGALALCTALALSGSAFAASAVTAAPASAATVPIAATSTTATSATASTCSPKLDLNVQYYGSLTSSTTATTSSAAASTAPTGWINTCQSGVVYEKWSGTETFGCPFLVIFDLYVGCLSTGNYGVAEIREPFAPYYRIWLHQDVDGAGWAECYYSEDKDIYIPTEYDNPGNVQVTSNTSPC